MSNHVFNAICLCFHGSKKQQHLMKFKMKVYTSGDVRTVCTLPEKEKKTPSLHRRPWTFTVRFHAVVQLHHRDHEDRRNDCANLLPLSSALVWLASCRSYNWELSVSASHLKCLCLVSAITQMSCCIIHFREIWQHLFKLSIARSWWKKNSSPSYLSVTSYNHFDNVGIREERRRRLYRKN